ncbi:protein translocase subunit SecD [Allosphingosinicella sp.]|jgi:preprotein translocase subunit SecD|uniref:protein translocase subunit SecD n=1 Tax=Allosphingosinicella sp. TaxID=2823234 RepID=UPI002F18B55E
MLDFPRWKVWATTLTLIVGILLAIPNFIPEHLTRGWPAFATQRINLGLDLAGGSHLLLEAQTQEVASQELDDMRTTMRRATRSNQIEIEALTADGGNVSFVVKNPGQVAQAAQLARDQTRAVGLGGSDWNVAIDGNRIVMTQSEAGLAAAVDRKMSVATEVVRRRVDELGTREPTIIRQGASRIVVQVPGLQDPQQLKDLLGRTARLEFRLVDPDAPPNLMLPWPEGGENARIGVQSTAMVNGDRISDARQDYDEQGAPAVVINFDNAGAHAFGRTTRDNVGKPFAIILDNVVISAPTIREAILGGTAQITGNFTVASANELAISLRSGRLPVTLEVVEERTVGPDLGKDSIVKGVRAGVIATVLVLVFMFLTYGRFGIYADIALILNAVLILGVMSAILPAALTLPGIAGFVLTIGAAVDANVIINERIREEQRRGRNILQSIEHGYNEARTAIFDANITNVIAGVLLYYFGSGPVRGFAVVMIIGIITSVFTAVTVTRMFVSIWLRRRPAKLVI